MKGDQIVIDTLNKLLTGEMSAADQYFIHSRMYQDWGLEKLYERLKHESEEELTHAAMLVERILFLQGVPDVASRAALNIGKDVTEMMENDLSYELTVASDLKEAIAICETQKDYQTREIIEELLKDTEEDHTYWLEQQLGLIDRIGIENYLQSQMS